MSDSLYIPLPPYTLQNAKSSQTRRELFKQALAFLLGCLITYTFTKIRDLGQVSRCVHTYSSNNGSARGSTPYDHHNLPEPNTSNDYWSIASILRLLQFEGDPDAFSKFKGPANQTVDEQWQSYWDVWTFWVSEEEALQDRSTMPSDIVQLSLSDGQPPRYLVTSEATHQLHCLYNLFRATNLEYYTAEGHYAAANAREWHERLDHCIDILRQKLECDSDPTLIFYRWVEGQSTPVADFSANHKCRDRSMAVGMMQDRRVSVLPSRNER